MLSARFNSSIYYPSYYKNEAYLLFLNINHYLIKNQTHIKSIKDNNNGLF